MSALPPGDWDLSVPDRALVSSWSAVSMDNYLNGLRRAQANAAAARADRLFAEGAGHHDVMMALAGAEERALPEDRPLHAARLDGYAAHYELRGWHRYVSHHGDHRVQVNLLRTVADGDKGRWFFYSPVAADRGSPRTLVSIVDRDTHHTVAQVRWSCARTMIRRIEAGETVTGETCDRAGCACDPTVPKDPYGNIVPRAAA